jgi:hypothetical protein
MTLGILAALLIASLVVAGCGSAPTPTPKPKYELPPKISHAEKSTLIEICAGEGAGVPEAAPYSQTSGTHPVVYGRSGLGWKPDNDYSNPWEPKELAEAELVACIVQEAETVEKCPYTLGNGQAATVSRIQLQTTVTLREAQTGKVVATSPTMKGSLPKECKESEQFSSGKTSKVVQGSEPISDVNAWLRQYVELP